MRKERENGIFKYIPAWAFALIALAALSLVILSLCRVFPPLADFLNDTLAALVRAVLSSLSVVFPFSLFECMLLLALPVFIYLVILAVRCDSLQGRIRGVAAMLAVISTFISSFVLTLGVGYHTTPLASRIGVAEKNDVTRDELYYTALTVRDRLNELAERIELSDGESRMGYSLTELSLKLSSAYGAIGERCSTPSGYFSRVKPIRYSGIMTDMGITGIYSYFTGEANVNTAYPDYCMPFTAAHEMAHQRGFSRENEANFVAFLVCEASDDPYVRYSGYLNLYGYLRNALYYTDKEAYKELQAGLSDIPRADVAAANAAIFALISSKVSKPYTLFSRLPVKLRFTPLITKNFITILPYSLYIPCKIPLPAYRQGQAPNTDSQNSSPDRKA